MSTTLPEQRRLARIQRIQAALSRIAGEDVAAELRFREETRELERQRDNDQAIAELAAHARTRAAALEGSPKHSKPPQLTKRVRQALNGKGPTQAPKPKRREPNATHQKYQRDLQWLERRRRQLGELEGAPRDFAVIPREVWQTARMCMASQRALWIELARTGNRAAVGALRRAAFAGGRRSWQSPYAHRVLVLGLCLLRLYQPIRSRDRGEKRARFRFKVEGIPREALCELLRDPRNDRVPCVETLSGTHRPNGSLENGQIGYLRALERSGFLWRFQRERPTRHNPDAQPSPNTYWIVAHSAYVFGDALQELQRLCTEGDELPRPLTRGPPDMPQA